MSTRDQAQFGKILWTDLSVPNASEIKDFYKDVVGWEEFPVPMKDNDESYTDFGVGNNGNAVGGICHQKGKNKNIPTQWIPYINVENVETSLSKAISGGGELIHEVRKQDGSYYFIIIKDPAGAYFGLGEF